MDMMMRNMLNSGLASFFDFRRFLESGEPLAQVCMITLTAMFLSLVCFTWTRKREWLLVSFSAGMYMVPVVMRGMHIM